MKVIKICSPSQYYSIRRKSRTLPLHYFYQRRVDIIDQIELRSPRPGYKFTPFVRCFTSEQLIIAHGKKGPTAFSVASEKHWQSGVKEIAKVSERLQRDSNLWALDCQSRTLAYEPPRPTGLYG